MDESSWHAKYFWNRSSSLRVYRTQTNRQTDFCLYYLDIAFSIRIMLMQVVTCKVYHHPSKTVYQKPFVDSVPPFFCPLWKCTTIPCRNCTIPFFAYLSCLKVYQHPMLNVYQHFWSFVHFIPRKFFINAIVWNCTIFLCGNCTNIFPLCNLH